MILLLLISLSAAPFQPVSAGGAYCAKTARARAAALGLDYPGVHGAPDLFGRSLHVFPPGASHHFPNLPPPLVADYNLLYPPQHHPARARSHKLAAASPVSILSGSESLPDLQSNPEQVKRVGPLTRTAARGQTDLANRAFEGQNKALPFVYNHRGFGHDALVPDRHRGMVVSALPRRYMAYPRQAFRAGRLYSAKDKQLSDEAAWPRYARFNNMQGSPPFFGKKLEG